LQLQNLREIDAQPPGATEAGPNEYVYNLADDRGHTVASFAWTPKHPGAEIVNSVVPFIAIALAGFALLAGLVLHYVRRTRATIAAGESRLRHLALHDPLCGLPNRIYFGERLESVINDVRNGAPPAAVFYIDLDHFKDVNDTLGHPIGDELIRNVTQRLTNTLRADDMVARLGGDEFAVLSSAGSDRTTLQAIANRIIAALCAPYTISNQTIVIGASIGISIIHEHVSSGSDVMRYADMALYRAKNEGRNRACIYDDAMDSDLLNRKLVENELRAAIGNDELSVAYQPIVNNSGETVVGVEALCRWHHPKRGEIEPSEFIPIAENSGLIIALGERVLRRACLDAKAWPNLTIAVNVSPLQFRRIDFVDVVERILAETGFDPTRLELEVTESTLLGNVDTAELAMFRLKALGVGLVLDDFGTGYSSLLYLRRFPFDKLKIDKSFVLAIEKAADAAAIVHAVVSLGRGLGMKVTAEGVETAEQHLFLRAAGVHTMQGYRFGRPGAALDITTRMSNPGTFRIADDTTNLALAG
jgi:diguanylate cyclase (GGDEF)-like protein